MPTSTFDLREWTHIDEPGADRDYLDIDFVIDGESLRDLLGADGTSSVLGWMAQDRSAVSQLLRETPASLPTGRVPLYVCTACGDLDCGAYSARVEETEDAFVWSDFTLEVTFFYKSEDERVLERFESVGPFVFDKAKYSAALSGWTPQLAL